MEGQRTGGEVLRYLRAMRRRIHLILLPIVLVPCAAITGLSFVTPVYESSSVIVYSEKLPFGRDMDKMIVQRPESRVEAKERLSQIEARLKGGPFLEEVARKLKIRLTGKALGRLESMRTVGVTGEELEKRILVEGLRENIKIAEIGPDLFRVTLSHTDRNMSYVLADGITKLFVEYIGKGQLADIRAVGSFTEDQLPVYEEKLRTSEERLRSFQAQIASRTTRESSTDARSLERLRSLVRQTELEISEVGGHRKLSAESLRRDFPNDIDPTTLVRGSAIKSAYQRVVREEESSVPLLVDGVSISSVMDKVGRARDELLVAIEQVAGVVLRGSPEALQRLVAEVVYDDHVIRSLGARKSRLAGLVSEYSSSAARKPQDDLQLRRLEQEVESNRSVLQSIRNQLTSSRISEAAQSTNLGIRIEIVEPPVLPLTASGPRKERVLVLAFILGPFLGVSFVVLSEYMDDSVKTAEDVMKSVGVKVLGTIPRMPGSGLWQPVRRTRWPYVAMLAAVVIALGSYLVHGPLLAVLGKGEKQIEAGSLYKPSDGS
ncbi:MAG: hypothetical protein V2A71_06420 [Candidatus Eisenbacteria bacterium]